MGQEPVLFSGTIRDNITFGLEGCGEEEVRAAAAAAGALDFVSALDQGFDTGECQGSWRGIPRHPGPAHASRPSLSTCRCGGERGAALSGGEAAHRHRPGPVAATHRPHPRRSHQRVGWGGRGGGERLEELRWEVPGPTAGADRCRHLPQLQQWVQTGGVQTVLLITHCPRVLEAADRVVVLERGAVVETGTPAELRSRHGPYSRLLQHCRGTRWPETLGMGCGKQPPAPAAAPGREEGSAPPGL